ncbi:MAG: hypothetical protein JXX28_03285 [Deltaproteobacteria bacterium]|nr:hypothetical protein [Deltaproteobacteria bacterium]
MDIPDFIVTGGQERHTPQGHEWNRYGEGRVARVSPATGTVELLTRYVSPPEACAWDETPGILFKSGQIHDGKLYVCTQTEVLVYRLSDMARVGYVSLPMFNDVHHVMVRGNGNLVVVSTGLDTVVEVTEAGEVVSEHNVLGQDTWARFSREVDYRKVLTTKPHHAHPNFAFELQGEMWATRFAQRDAVCLTDLSRRIPVDVQSPHDGVVRDDEVFFTTVDGRVVVSDHAAGRVKDVYDLNLISGQKGVSLGWCRGLKLLDRRVALVGFTRVRPTKIQQNVAWVKYVTGVAKTKSVNKTRVAAYDLEAGELLWEQVLEDVGMHALFSIL